MNNYTAFNANLNSIQARLDARRTAPQIACDMCGGRATNAVHRVEGANVLTAYVCGACRKVWEATK